MSSAFMNMNMEVGMEENPFEDGGVPAESSEKKKSGTPDGFIDSADAFEENPFEPVMETVAADSLPVQEEADSDGAWEETEEENEYLETDEAEEAEEIDKAKENNTEIPDADKESEDKKRAENEAAEARRKAEWEARQQAKKEAEQEQLARMSALSDEEVAVEAMKRVGADTERLTRRNMKEGVSEYRILLLPGLLTELL